MSVTLGELAVRFGCELRGEPATEVDSVATLGNAHPGAITFFANPRLKDQLLATRATAVVLDAQSASQCPTACLIAENPHATFARIAAVLYPRPQFPAGIHPRAVVSPGAQIDPSAHVAAFALIENGAQIGPRAVVGPHCVIDEDAQIAEDVWLVARVTLCRGVQVGARSIIQPGAVIGGDGFGFAKDRSGWIKVPQVGTVRIGVDVEIGANTTIDRGAIEDTVIEDGVKLDNQIQIGHNVHVGAHTAMAACVGVSGSVVIGKRCMIGGAVGIVGHLSICDDVAVTGLTMISHSITKPGVYSGGIPAEDARTWRKIVARLKRIEALARRVSALERASGANVPDEQEKSDE
jgi:UDP-3-O-[3-hydroxymyristoyl] glucosamine N-acyltransferase